MARPKKSIEETIKKNYPEFIDVVNGLSVSDLEKKLSEYAKHRNEVEEAQENDEQLDEAKAQASELAAPYRDAKKAISLKSKYIITRIKEKGGNA